MWNSGQGQVEILKYRERRKKKELFTDSFDRDEVGNFFQNFSSIQTRMMWRRNEAERNWRIRRWRCKKKKMKEKRRHLVKEKWRSTDEDMIPRRRRIRRRRTRIREDRRGVRVRLNTHTHTYTQVRVKEASAGVKQVPHAKRTLYLDRISRPVTARPRWSSVVSR